MSGWGMTSTQSASMAAERPDRGLQRAAQTIVLLLALGATSLAALAESVTSTSAFGGAIPRRI